MRPIRFALLIAAILIASFGNAYAQTADEIIQKHIAAIGGEDNWKKITSIKKICVRNARGNDVPVIITIQQGKGYRTESTINGMTSYSIITEHSGWSYNPSRGQQKPDVMTEETVKQAQTILDIQGPLIGYKEKGNKVIYLGKDDVEGTECFKLKVTYPIGKEETYFIDAGDYSLVRTVAKIKANGREQTQTTTYGSYEKLPEGITIPMSIDNGGGGINVKSVVINCIIDDNIFKVQN